MKQWTVIAGIVLLDQLSKHWIDSALGFAPTLPVIAGRYRHGFKLLSFITRGCIQFLSDAGGWQRWFLLILSSVVSVAIAVWLRSLEEAGLATGWPCFGAGRRHWQSH